MSQPRRCHAGRLDRVDHLFRAARTSRQIMQLQARDRGEEDGRRVQIGCARRDRGSRGEEKEGAGKGRRCRYLVRKRREEEGGRRE